MIGPFFDMVTAAMFNFFFCDVPICASLEQSFYCLWRAGSPGSAFYGSGVVCLPSWLGMVNGGWLISMWSEIFLQMKFIIFQGCPTKQAAFLSWQPAPYNQLLIQPLLHFCIKCWSLDFEILSSLFSKCSFHRLQHFFL